ncbi:MAG: Aspartate aminotransferase [Chlamydiae bacterium]|nr:Aspartate aminotransferase [Chlamydiota bacterium]
MHPYDQIRELPADPIFGLSAKFKADKRPGKFTFVTGYFRKQDLTTPVLDTVAEAEKRLAEARHKREYLPIDGDLEFATEIGKLAFGSHWDPEKIYGLQTVGGTGALFLIGKLAKAWTNVIAISDPTWTNHWGIFTLAGLKTEPYPYYANRKLQFDGCVEKLQSLPKGACVLIHTNCHNTTGFDLTKEQWQELCALVEKKQLYPILDMAYQGFSATPDEDAYGPRLFFEKGLNFALTYTCAKNFSIYGERAGALFVVDQSSKNLRAIKSQIKAQIRGCYSNPPIHAAAIVKTILKSSDLKAKWLKELEGMRKRMHAVRNAFVDLLVQKDPEGNWEPIRQGKGLFCCSDLSSKAVTRLCEEKALYVAVDGRINLTGLNDQNLEQFVDALLEMQ